MIRITIRPKTTSWPWDEPISGTSAETVGSSPMKEGADEHAPEGAEAGDGCADQDLERERTPNSFGWANPFVTRTKSDPATPAKAAETRTRASCRSERDTRGRRSHRAVADRPERAADSSRAGARRART